jgi:hypothetical protein
MLICEIVIKRSLLHMLWVSFIICIPFIYFNMRVHVYPPRSIVCRFTDSLILFPSLGYSKERSNVVGNRVVGGGDFVSSRCLARQTYPNLWYKYLAAVSRSDGFSVMVTQQLGAAPSGVFFRWLEGCAPRRFRFLNNSASNMMKILLYTMNCKGLGRM